MENINLDEVTDLIQNKKFEEARSILEPLASGDEKHIDGLKLLGLCNINLDRYEEAKSNYETVVKYAPEDALSWFYLASCYDNLEDNLHAVAAYEKVIELRENYVEAYKCLAVIYIKNRQEEKAIEYGKKALEFEKTDYTLYYIVGTAYMSLKNFEESVKYLEKALELQPNHSQLYNNLGTSYITIGNLEKAYENFVKASKLDPDNSITYFNIASILQIQNKHKEACEYFAKAYTIEPNDSYLTAMALSEVKIQDWENAIKHYKLLATHHPEKQTFQYNLACCYEETGEYRYAIAILTKLVSMNPKSVSMSQKLAELFLKTNQPILAKDIYERLLLLGNVGFEVYYKFAHICLTLQDLDRAEKILKKVIELKPDFANAHKDLGVLYLSKRLFDYAKDEFTAALDVAPEDFSILSEYANFLHATADFKEADKYYQKALEINPNGYETLAFSALNKMFLKEYDIALEQINKAIGNSLQNGFFLYIAGKIRFLMKNYEDAKMYLIKSFELEQNPEVKNLLAMCYYELKNYEQAKNIFKNLLETNQDNINLLLWIAKCDKELGNTDEALKNLETAVDIFPEFEEAHEMIRELS